MTVSNMPIDLTGKVLHFDMVSYTYPGRALAAVHDISFTAAPGQQIALVGASGAGKTTIAMLLLRFIEPETGGIRLGEQNIVGLTPDVWRSQVAWVPQQPYLFHTTIADNLRLARPAATHAQLRHAAHLALLDDWIQSLPVGYETLIGEQGARLSGGQAQRLALARAFLKDAPLLIMDEPTAHLDPEQEALLEEATRRLCVGRRVILIAHRLPSIYRSDQILFMAGGQIIESGSHNELYKLGRAYYRLVNAYQEQSS
jgi:ABC-type multidrug transport system fused ATPase/permease subunit